MKRSGKIIISAAVAVLGIPLVLISVFVMLHAGADLCDPGFVPSEGEAVIRDSVRVWKDDYLRFNPSGIIEMRVSGSPYERGEAIGKLAPDLLEAQEKAFVDKLYEIVPSSIYRSFLKYFITVFNRRLGENVTEEFRQEIRAMSEYCSHDFDEYGTPYERQMQYHSAHDIGHVMQDYMLVGCSSFAVWGPESADGELLVGRNFDFYMGEEFSGRNMLLVEKPDSGHAFVSVTWPGMTGVLSGMNEEGLTVTINASKFETPRMSATPVSLLTREILQYASDIDEAWKIASSRKTFVSESILVTSVRDGRAAIIEKTPSEMGLYDPACGNGEIHRIVCTNHYQSDLFRDRKENLENIAMSDSGERWNRVSELLDSAGTMDPVKAAAVLRERRGTGGRELGLCNELSINQLIAMHSVIFRPASRQIWVSTSPWQCGKFVCYDLDALLSDEGIPDAAVPCLDIPEDDFLLTGGYRNAVEFRSLMHEITMAISKGKRIAQDSIEAFVSSNPLYYNTYNILGDYFLAIGDSDAACEHWKKSLSFEMKMQDRVRIEEKLSRTRR
ncbi:MAG: C45 family autoproteolytic acyltransferase/hydrolase [Candidatus Cryptobacteroides sp.]